MVLIICPDKEPMARDLSIFVDESGDRGGKARYNMKELDEEASEKVLEQTENLKAESNCSFEAMKWSKQAKSDLQRRTA